MDILTIISFLIASIALTIMPGTDNIFVLTESLTKGYKNGIALSVGLASGVLIHTLLAATGISIIIKQSNFLFEIIKILGTLYVFYLALITLKEKQFFTNIEDVQSGNIKFFKIAQKGFLMNILNPKVSIFFIAFLPQFITDSKINSIYQMIILGLIFMIQTLIIFSTIAAVSARFSIFLNNPKNWKITMYSKSAILFLIGTYLLSSNI